MKTWVNKLLHFLFFGFFAKFIVLIVIGLRISHKERLPKRGPAIVVANHNSHLDTLVIMTIFPLGLLDELHPVAAEDYWFSNAFLKWFSLNIIRAIPLKRQANSSKKDPPLSGCIKALEAGKILIIYPEGSRGSPEDLSQFKSGIAHLAKCHPEIPVYPIFLRGLGKALPKGEALLVPFFCDVFIGEPIYWTGSKPSFMDLFVQTMQDLANQGKFPPWE